MSAFPTCLLPAGVLVALDGSTCSFEGSTRNSDYQEGPGTCHCEEKAGGDIDHQGTSKSVPKTEDQGLLLPNNYLKWLFQVFRAPNHGKHFFQCMDTKIAGLGGEDQNLGGQASQKQAR